MSQIQKSKFLFLFFSLKIFFLFLNKPTKSNRLEPLNILNERSKFYNENLNNFTTKINLVQKNYTHPIKEKENLNKKKCIFNSNIKKNEEIFSIDLQNTINIFDNFPLKKLFLNKILSTNFAEINKNSTSHLLLSLRILFDSKANFRETFIKLKKFDEKEFQIMKNYMKNRNEFIHKYINLLPIAENFGQMSWGVDDFEEYKISGNMPNSKDKVKLFYKEILDDIRSEEDFYFFNLTKNWLNEQNSNYFLSIYGYVSSRSLPFDIDYLLEDYDYEDSNRNKNLEIYDTEVNKEIIKNNGGLIIIPFIDQCGNYHPGKENNNDLIEETFKLKKLKISYDKKSDKISILANTNSIKNEEFTYSYTDFLTNDNLLLNYGIIIPNNIFQEFLFKFEMEDPKYKFLNLLKKNNFDISTVNFLGDYKLSLQFSLKKDSFSKSLFDFIKIYSTNFIEDETLPKEKKKKFVEKKMDKGIYYLYKSLVLYESTINRNVNNFYEIEGEEQNVINNRDPFDDIFDTLGKINKINGVIFNNTFAINEEKGLKEFLHDDVKNLFYYKALHDNEKSLRIKLFNLENLKILYSHKDIVNKEVIAILNKNIKDLKKNYIE